MPWLTPDAPTLTGGRILFIPDTYRPAVNGALLELANKWNWEQFGDETPEDAAERMRVMFEDYIVSIVSPDFVPASGYLPVHYPGVLSTPISLSTDGSQMDGVYWSADTPAINQNIGWKVPALAGQRLFIQVYGQKQNSLGILKLLINGTTVSTWDAYSSSVVRNAGNTYSGYDVTVDGYQDILLKCDAKNASSSNYNFRLTRVAYWIDVS